MKESRIRPSSRRPTARTSNFLRTVSSRRAVCAWISTGRPPTIWPGCTSKLTPLTALVPSLRNRVRRTCQVVNPMEYLVLSVSTSTWARLSRNAFSSILPSAVNGVWRIMNAPRSGFAAASAVALWRCAITAVAVIVARKSRRVVSRDIAIYNLQ